MKAKSIFVILFISASIFIAANIFWLMRGCIFISNRIAFDHSYISVDVSGFPSCFTGGFPLQNNLQIMKHNCSVETKSKLKRRYKLSMGKFWENSSPINYTATHNISFILGSFVTRAFGINSSLFRYRWILLGQGGDIVALFAFHINHVVSTSRRSSRKRVVHAISLVTPRATWAVENILYM